MDDVSRPVSEPVEEEEEVVEEEGVVEEEEIVSEQEKCTSKWLKGRNKA